MNDFVTRACELFDEMVEKRRYIHQHGETGMELPKTHTFIMEKLKSYGYDLQILASVLRFSPSRCH
ncbi:hypothetical protein ACDL92_00830 [Ihubacter sp. mB4P-1]|uniref:hypothetical protein n=1 Tax=Ihubacter sp. mB4P-1 TaxID=3242370 RepID=UPI00137A037B